MRYPFVAAERAGYPVRLLCRVVGVAVSGFYAWLRRGPSRRRADDQRLSARIGAAFEDSRRTYGSPRIHAELRARGVRVGRKRVARLMREGGLAAVRRRIRQQYRDRGNSTPSSAKPPDPNKRSPPQGAGYSGVHSSCSPRAAGNATRRDSPDCPGGRSP